MDSGLRKLAILAKLSKYRKISASQIQKQLGNEGTETSLRTIQRDLVELSSQFPVCGDESKPIGWSIDKMAELSLSDFDLTTSVTFVLADKHLANLLPPSMRETLEPYFRTAKQFIRSESKKSVSHWPEKIEVHTKGLPLHPSDISEKIIEAIYSSVLSEQCLKVSYCSLTSGEESHFIFHPYGIAVRSERSYLIGRYDEYADIRQLAISRILEAEKLDKAADIDPDFSLKDFVAQGEMGVIRDNEKLNIKLWITPVLKTILTETPLAENQNIEPEGDDFILTASVDDTDELRHWILSMCNHVTVLSPLKLKNEVIEYLSNSLSYYQ